MKRRLKEVDSDVVYESDEEDVAVEQAPKRLRFTYIYPWFSMGAESDRRLFPELNEMFRVRYLTYRDHLMLARTCKAEYKIYTWMQQPARHSLYTPDAKTARVHYDDVTITDEDLVYFNAQRALVAPPLHLLNLPMSEITLARLVAPHYSAINVELAATEADVSIQGGLTVWDPRLTHEYAHDGVRIQYSNGQYNMPYLAWTEKRWPTAKRYLFDSRWEDWNYLLRYYHAKGWLDNPSLALWKWNHPNFYSLASLEFTNNNGTVETVMSLRFDTVKPTKYKLSDGEKTFLDQLSYESVYTRKTQEDSTLGDGTREYNNGRGGYFVYAKDSSRYHVAVFFIYTKDSDHIEESIKAIKLMTYGLSIG